MGPLNPARALASAGCALLLAITLPGCGAVGDVAADVLLPPQQEEQLGRRMAQEVEANSRVLPDPAAQRRLDAMGERLLAQADRADLPYDFKFTILAEPDTVNAFALPGGHIYVASGLMRVARTDAQLAAVLAHEIAHVTQRHIAERLATQYGVDLLASAALGQDPGLLSGLVGSVLQQGFLLKYSREQELEADRVGVRYLDDAGYDPRAAIEMFRNLAAASGDGRPPVFLSSHPTTEQRIEQLERVVAQQ